MKAIPTTYRGFRFRSRLEAKWASFLDRIDIEWQYEPQAFETSAGPYLPDFWLPSVHLRGRPGSAYLEIKAGPMTATEQAKARSLAEGTQHPVLVATSAPGPGIFVPTEHESLYEFAPGCFKGMEYVDEDDGLSFARCRCGKLNANFHASDTDRCPCCAGIFDPEDMVLEEARLAFPNLARWERAA